MDISKVGLKLIADFEGIKLEAYDDGVGVWTIGIGTIQYPNGVKVKKGDKCTLDQAYEYLNHHLKHDVVGKLNESIKVTVSQNQFDALASLVYNIGITNFNKSTLLRKLNTKDFKAAAEQFLVWNRGGGKVMKGLTRRREAEKDLFTKV